ncbi:hypothetical protein V8E54_001269 [Elaphomyces granulatus]
MDINRIYRKGMETEAFGKPSKPFTEGGELFQSLSIRGANRPRRARLYGIPLFQPVDQKKRNNRRRIPNPVSLEAVLDEIVGQGVISPDEEPVPEFVDTLRSACRDLAYQLILSRLENQNKAIESPIDDRFGSVVMSIDTPTFNSFLTVEPPAIIIPEMSVVGTPILDSFLISIAELVKNRDGPKLQDFLQIEPPVPEIYERMVLELKAHYPSGGQGDTELFKRCEAAAPRTKGGTPWTAFATFMKLYFSFIRDVNVGNLLETYNLLKGLVNQCVLALGDSQLGVIVLPTVFYLSKVLAKLAMGLDRRPELIAHLLRQEGQSQRDETAEKVTLVEQSANVVREAFIKCLADRSGMPGGAQGKPEGKRVGIYLMANLCLKLLFQCGKLRNAEQMFASISAQSPPLDYFPASQRVTYLYYLGRYLFSNNLFFPARTALQAAYDQSPRQALKQRHLILTYLIPCNIIMGRFPSRVLLQRPEATVLVDRFAPICQLIMSGDYIAFRRHLSVDSPAAEWFAAKGILLQLRNRCEILVWRSLIRKVFIYGGFHTDPTPQTQRGPPPFLYLHKLEVAVKWLQTRYSTLVSSPTMPQAAYKDSQAANSGYGSDIVYIPRDPDFAGLNGFSSQVASKASIDDYLSPEGYFDAEGRWRDNISRFLVDGEPDAEHILHLDELNPYSATPKDATSQQEKPTALIRELESILASLHVQGLIRGYLTHKNPRFAIPGARHRGALPTGFPNVWQTIDSREIEKGKEVPGWVRPPTVSQPGWPSSVNPFNGAGGGRVVNLSGARPVGAQ